MARRMNLVRSDDDKRRQNKASGNYKHFAFLILGMTSVTLVGMVFPTISRHGNNNAARQLFLPQPENHGHQQQQQLHVKNNTGQHHAPPHRAFGDYQIGAANMSPESNSTTISKLQTNNTSVLTTYTRGVVMASKKRNKDSHDDDDDDDGDDDNRPIFFLHVGIPKTATTFLQCTICKDYYADAAKSPTSGSTTNDTTILGRHERIFRQDNLVYLGTCPCGGDEQLSDQFVAHNHDAIFDHKITWNEQHELGPVPFVDVSNNNKNNATTKSIKISTLLKNQTGMIPQLADSFRTRILLLAQQQGRRDKNNAIMIFEGCHKFDQAHVAALAAFLNPLFHVHVIVAYRRLFEWLPSKYNSVYKPIGHGPIVENAWPGMTVSVMQYGHPINKTIPTTMPFTLVDDHDRNDNSFGQLVRDIETWQQHPAQIVRDNYAVYFSKIEVINLHDVPEPPRGTTMPKHNAATAADATADTAVAASSSLVSINPYLHHVFCSVLASSARHVCQAIRLGQIRGASEESSNPSVSLDYFRLAEAAQQQGWIPAHMSRSKVARLVQEKMRADKEETQIMMSAAQPSPFDATTIQQQQNPLQCLPNAALSRIINLSLATEAKMFGSQQAEKWRLGHELAFEAYRSKNKHCWLDTATLLRIHDNTNANNNDVNKNASSNSDWRVFFKRLAH